MTDLPSVSQLRWRCRRGMLELDVMLRRYLDGPYGTLSEREQSEFVALLETEDDKLWVWLSGRQTPADPRLAALCERIRRPA